MKLHANAALSLNKRRLLAQRMVERDWSLTKAAATSPAEYLARDDASVDRWQQVLQAARLECLLDGGRWPPHSKPGSRPKRLVRDPNH